MVLVQLFEAREQLQELITGPFFVSAPLPGLDPQMFVPDELRYLIFLFKFLSLETGEEIA